MGTALTANRQGQEGIRAKRVQTGPVLTRGREIATTLHMEPSLAQKGQLCTPRPQISPAGPTVQHKSLGQQPWARKQRRWGRRTALISGPARARARVLRWHEYGRGATQELTVCAEIGSDQSAVSHSSFDPNQFRSAQSLQPRRPDIKIRPADFQIGNDRQRGSTARGLGPSAHREASTRERSSGA